MKILLTMTLLTVSAFVSACSDKTAADRQTKEDVEAKARAEAARKEMETLPKTFQNRDYFKKNAPDSGTSSPTPKPKASPS